MEDVAPGGGAGMGYRVASVVVVALAGLLLGSLGEWCSRELGGELPDLVLDASVGWAFLAVGLIAWWREPRNRIARRLAGSLRDAADSWEEAALDLLLADGPGRPP